MPISWRRFFAVWIAMAIAMSANGVFRELVLRKSAGDMLADILSAVIGIFLIAVITRVGFRIIPSGVSTRSLLTLSAVLVALTVGFEFAVGRLVDRKSWQELVAHYELWKGELWPLLLGFLAVTPFVWSRGVRRRYIGRESQTQEDI